MRTEILGVTGPVSNVRYGGGDPSCGDVDPRRMAAWALNYLTRTPRPELNYQPVFQIFPLKFPSVREGYDPVVDCDTDARMEWEWFYMRDLSGEHTFGRDVEEKFHERMRGYIGEDGLAHATGGCYHEDLPDAVWGEEDKIIHVWGTLKILRSLCEEYKRTRNPERLSLAKKIMSALRGFFIWGRDERGAVYCYAPNGMGPYDPKTENGSGKNGWCTHPAPAVGPLLDYHILTGDPDALAFARAAAKGIMESRMPDSVVFGPDGSFRQPKNVDANCSPAHSHATLHAVWGVAELGLFTGERACLEFARRSFDWMMTRGTGTGWFPAMPDSCCETCAVSDMISIAALLGRAGWAEYFDYAERFFRNYIVNLQFILSPEIESWYRRVHAGCPPDQVERQLELLRRAQGAIIGGSGVNDYENDLLGRVSGFSIFGCCAPEGMRALHTIAEAVASDERDNAFLSDGLYIHIPLNLKTETCEVSSLFPGTGGAEISVFKDTRLYVRVPHWADCDAVTLTVNGKQMAPEWINPEAVSRYMAVDAKSGDTIRVTWPLVAFTHTSGVWPDSAPELMVQFGWLGNSVIDCRPDAASGSIPLFNAKPRLLPEYKFE